jgi:transcriptional regulator with XRE-family HTH domain
MPHPSKYVDAVLARLKKLREEAHITATELDDKLILGPGWIERFETGQTVPSIRLILAILHALRKTPDDLFGQISAADIPGDFIDKFTRYRMVRTWSFVSITGNTTHSIDWPTRLWNNSMLSLRPCAMGCLF